MQRAGHSQPMVRRWAGERLKTLYGKAGLEVLKKLMEDKDPAVLFQALDYLEAYPEHGFGDALLRLYKTHTGAVGERCAELLGTFQDERLITAYERKRKTLTIEREEKLCLMLALGSLGTDLARAVLRGLVPEIKEDSDPDIIDVVISSLLKAREDIPVLLQTYARWYREWGMEILLPYLRACGSWYSLEELKTEGEKKLLGKSLPPVVQEALEFIQEKGFSSLAKDLRKAFFRQDYRRVIEIAGQWTDQSVGQKGAEVREKLSLKSDLPPAVNYQVLRAFKDFLETGPEDSFKGIATATLPILSQFIALKSLWGLKVEAVDPLGLISILFEDRDENRMDDQMMERVLAEVDPRTVLDLCLRQMEDHPHSYGTERALRLLGKLKDGRAIPSMLAFLERTENEDLLDEWASAMTRVGSPLVDEVEKNFGQLHSKQLVEIMHVLRDLPEEKTVDFLLRHWEALWSMDKGSFLEALEGIGSPRFIEPLRKELREGEATEEKVFFLLCHLHGVKESLLPRIQENMAERKKKAQRFAEALQRNGAPSGPANVELKCRRCAKSYSYEVENVYFFPGKAAKPSIGDKIVCKNCRAINQYEITARGHLSITTHALLIAALADEEQLKRKDSPIKSADVALVDGRPMSPEGALEYYREATRKSPEDPALRVGYGNVLLKKGMEAEAVGQYQEALRLDPLAVEAYASLGEYEGDKGNPSGAYEYYQKAAERIHTGHYYRTKEIDQLKEAVILNRQHYGELLGKSSPQVPDTSALGIVKRERIGRNAPCPCGSGKKYKKCCLSKDEAAGAEKTSATPVEMALRDQLFSFSGNARFRKDFEKAYSLFWRKPFQEPLVLDKEREASFGFFHDWFIHDFRLGNDLTLIEQFYGERKAKLSPEERCLLESQIASHLSLYEVIEVTPEVGLKLKDLIAGDIVDILEVKGSRSLAKWDIILARVFKVGAVNKFSGMVNFIPRREKDGVFSSIRKAWEKFKEASGKTAWSDFAKAKAHQIFHRIEGQPRIEPVFLTEEGHPIVSSKAIFLIEGFDAIRYRFRREFDFVLDEDGEGKEIQWSWLKRGQSKDWESGEAPEHGMVLKSEMVLEGGDLRWVSLGTVTWTPGRLELWCLSKERLNRGKKRLREILGDDIRHLADTFEDLRKAAKRKPKEDAHVEDETFQEQFLPLYSKTMEQWATRWIDERIPALGGKTPREAVKTREGRNQVEEILKDFENAEERKRREGGPYLDIQVLRRMLNL